MFFALVSSRAEAPLARRRSTWRDFIGRRPTSSCAQARGVASPSCTFWRGGTARKGDGQPHLSRAAVCGSLARAKEIGLLSGQRGASAHVPHRPTRAAAARSSGSASSRRFLPRRSAGPSRARGARRARRRGSSPPRVEDGFGERGGEDHRRCGTPGTGMRAAQRAATPLMKPSTTAATPSRAASMRPRAGHGRQLSRRAAAAPRAPRAPSRPTAPLWPARRGRVRMRRAPWPPCARGRASSRCRPRPQHAAASAPVSAQSSAAARRVADAHLADGDHLGFRDLVGDAVRPGLARVRARLRPSPGRFVGRRTPRAALACRTVIHG